MVSGQNTIHKQNRTNKLAAALGVATLLVSTYDFNSLKAQADEEPGWSVTGNRSESRTFTAPHILDEKGNPRTVTVKYNYNAIRKEYSFVIDPDGFNNESNRVVVSKSKPSQSDILEALKKQADWLNSNKEPAAFFSDISANSTEFAAFHDAVVDNQDIDDAVATAHEVVSKAAEHQATIEKYNKAKSEFDKTTEGKDSPTLSAARLRARVADKKGPSAELLALEKEKVEAEAKLAEIKEIKEDVEGLRQVQKANTRTLEGIGKKYDAKFVTCNDKEQHEIYTHILARRAGPGEQAGPLVQLSRLDKACNGLKAICTYAEIECTYDNGVKIPFTGNIACPSLADAKSCPNVQECMRASGGIESTDSIDTTLTKSGYSAQPETNSNTSPSGEATKGN